MASDTGRPPEGLVENVVSGYFDELAQARETLDTRYDDGRSGKVKMIPADIVEAELRQRRAERGSPDT